MVLLHAAAAVCQTVPPDTSNLFGLEFVNKRLDINMGVGLYEEAGGDHGVYLKAGYRYVIPVGALLFKPGFDLDYFFGSSIVMGRIDNLNKDIIVPGYEAGVPAYLRTQRWFSRRGRGGG
jgi:hypothetical protein